jgi:hypothetical protein
VFQRGCQMYRDAGLTNEIRAVVLIHVECALPLFSPAYDRGETEEQVKDRWRRYWRKLWGNSSGELSDMCGFGWFHSPIGCKR